MLVVTTRFTQRTAIGQQQEPIGSNRAAIGQRHHAVGNKQGHTSFSNPSLVAAQQRDKTRLASTLLMIAMCHRDQQYKAIDVSVVSM